MKELDNSSVAPAKSVSTPMPAKSFAEIYGYTLAAQSPPTIGSKIMAGYLKKQGRPLPAGSNVSATGPNKAPVFRSNFAPTDQSAGNAGQ